RLRGGGKLGTGAGIPRSAGARQRLRLRLFLSPRPRPRGASAARRGTRNEAVTGRTRRRCPSGRGRYSGGQPAPPCGRPMLRQRILVIDDDPHLMRVLSMFLQVEGYEVLCARDGEEGLHRLETGGADLVILDVMMAGMDGVSACRAIKSDARFQRIPVVMFTA